MTPDDAFGSKLIYYKRYPRAMVMELFGVKPDPAQCSVLDCFPHSPRIAMQSCTGAGKTATLSWIAWNFLLTRESPMIGAAAVTRANLDANLWPELARWYSRSREGVLEHLFEITADEIRLRAAPDLWKLTARGWRQDADASQIGNALRGLHAPYVMWLLDEAGACPDAVLPTMEAIFSGDPKEAHIVQAGNPTHLRGPLYAASRNKIDWLVVEITADPDDPRRTPRVSVEHAQQQIKQWGRDSPWVIVNIFGRFPPSSLDSLIGVDEVEAAMKRYYRDYQIGTDAARVMGVDVARYGDDASCLAYRQGIQAFPFKRYRDLNSTQGAGIVAREWEEFKADAVFIDDTGGFGAGWIDRLRLLRRSPFGVAFSGKPHALDRYQNKRAEMYFDMVAWIKEGGALPDSPQLKAALTQTTYTFGKNTGLLMLEPKEQIKAKLGYSPDEADALCVVGETLIATPRGPVAIENLAVGDEVLTPFGRSKIGAMWTRPVMTLTTARFSNRGSLSGTPDHGVFVWGLGKITLDALSLTMVISPLEERRRWRIASSLFTRAKSIGFKNLADISLPGVLSSASGFCIGAYGRRKGDRSPKDGTSTTRIGTGAIAALRILSAWKNETTLRCISSNGATSGAPMSALSPVSRVRERRQRLGMLQKLDGSGTLTMAANPGLGGNRTTGLAPNVAACFSPITSVPGFVRAHVRKLSSGVAGAMLRIVGHARTAAKALWPIVSEKQHVVPVSVQTENVPPTLVYNLTLERDNAYYANGILVFNCLTFAEPVVMAKKPIVPLRQRDEEWNPWREQEQTTRGYRPF